MDGETEMTIIIIEDPETTTTKVKDQKEMSLERTETEETLRIETTSIQDIIQEIIITLTILEIEQIL